jgi:hypothetical protein
VRIRDLVAITVVLAGLVPAASAAAATRFANPLGSGGACTATDPCKIQTAINSASSPSTVVLQPGDYGSAAAPLTDQLSSLQPLDVHGTDGQPPPRIFTSASPGISLLSNTPSHLRDVRVEQTAAAVAVMAGGVVERVYVRSAGDACVPLGYDATFRDSVCWTTGAGSAALALEIGGFGPGTPMTVYGRNLIAYASGPSGTGIRLSAGEYEQLTLVASNVIASGSTDVKARGSSGAGAPYAHIQLDHSNYDTTATEGPDATVTPAGSGSNQMAAPLLEAPGSGDFHQLTGSPTIDAGADDALNGAFDLDGAARTRGPRTDIGAYESAAPPTAPVVTPQPGPTGTPLATFTGVQILTRKLRANRRGRTRVRLSCPVTDTNGCSAKLSLRLRTNKARVVKLGSGTRKLAAGRKGWATIKLTRRARKLLRHHRRVAATLVVRTVGAPSSSAAVALLPAVRRHR